MCLLNLFGFAEVGVPRALDEKMSLSGLINRSEGPEQESKGDLLFEHLERYASWQSWEACHVIFQEF